MTKDPSLTILDQLSALLQVIMQLLGRIGRLVDLTPKNYLQKLYSKDTGKPLIFKPSESANLMCSGNAIVKMDELLRNHDK